MKMTYWIAHSIGMGTANQQMRDQGRTIWSEDDYDLAAAVLNRHFPAYAELPGIEPERCGCNKCLPEELTSSLSWTSNERPEGRRATPSGFL